jgi:glycolate oxidase FAD binding subunit
MPVSADDLPGASVLAGRGSIRAAGPGDAVDGVVPRVVVEPDRPEALADLLKWCTRERLSVVVRGGGSKLGWGNPPRPIDLVIATKRLDRVLVHAHGDLTATIESGANLREVNTRLALHQQWLPVDSPFDAATIGGILSTNDSGSLRHRYGTPRDLLIGIRLATTDGLLVKSGGTVVKNVAGYDLCKLITGSFGSLAAIVSATFKLAPIPKASASLVVTAPDATTLAAAATAIASSQVEATAFDVRIGAGRRPGRSHQLLLRIATTADAIREQVERAQALIGPDVESTLVQDHAEGELWNGVTNDPWSAPGAIVRLSWLQSSLPAVAALVEELGASAEEASLVGRVVVGAGFLRIQGDPAAQSAAIDRLRAAAGVVGNIVILRADTSVREKAGVFGPLPDTATLLREIKRAFDPAGILNAGRGLV